MSELFDARPCSLGEGPLWHPGRSQLYWFDINAKRLLSSDGTSADSWQMHEHVSAAAWIDLDTLLVASESSLFLFDLVQGCSVGCVAALEPDEAQTRSNDGRADPHGGFWIGTMGKRAEPGRGSIYRWFRGSLERLYTGLTIPNAISFSPDGRSAYFTDTPTQQIMRQPLDGEGWPVGEAELFIDLRTDQLNPDGAVVDSAGCLWNAQWGAGRVSRYAPSGELLDVIRFPAAQVSCPEIGGVHLNTLFVTSASEGLRSPGSEDGATFCAAIKVKGQPQYPVRIE